jgi:hypothetical protein
VNPNLTAVADEIVTRRSGSGTGSGRSSRLFTMLKMAVFAPIPSASMTQATVVKPGLRRSARMA